MDNKIKFTKENLDALPSPDSGKRDIYHDTKTSGLQLRVTGVKTFLLIGVLKAAILSGLLWDAILK